MSEITKAVLDMPMDIAVCGHIASVQYWLASQARITQLQADLKAAQADCKRVEEQRDECRRIADHNEMMARKWMDQSEKAVEMVGLSATKYKELEEAGQAVVDIEYSSEPILPSDPPWRKRKRAVHTLAALLPSHTEIEDSES